MQRLIIKKEWNDRTIHPAVYHQLQPFVDWHQVNSRHINTSQPTNYAILFHGPTGAGKKMTTAKLSDLTGRDVYRVDLSQVVSKYIGETEKNLKKIFDEAAGKKWILFFDEADALFGKRSEVKNAHDRYATAINFLLERIQQYSGIVILASQNKSDIDPRLLQKIRLTIDFPGT